MKGGQAEQSPQLNLTTSKVLIFIGEAGEKPSKHGRDQL